MSIPMKATIFITYIIVDGWSGFAVEILRLVPLVMFHLKNTFLVKTEQDREQAMDPSCWTLLHLDLEYSFISCWGLCILWLRLGRGEGAGGFEVSDTYKRF